MAQRLAAMTLWNTDADHLASLVTQARAGDEEAFGRLVEHSWGDLVALARGLLASDQGAEDLVQEAFVHAWKRLWTLRKPGSFSAWMRRIVARRCWTALRRRHPTEPLRDMPRDLPEMGASLDLRMLLRALPARQRAAVHMSWILGYSDREVGSILGIRAATVRVHRRRGLRQLRRMVEGEADE